MKKRITRLIMKPSKRIVLITLAVLMIAVLCAGCRREERAALALDPGKLSRIEVFAHFPVEGHAYRKELTDSRMIRQAAEVLNSVSYNTSKQEYGLPDGGWSMALKLYHDDGEPEVIQILVMGEGDILIRPGSDARYDGTWAEPLDFWESLDVPAEEISLDTDWPQ